ncbi:MAG: glycoside hydrolase family 3 N-terminal domain-containing protein [Thermoanaerobaculia bacterium]
MCATVPQQSTGKLPRVEDLTLDEKIGQLFVHAGHGLYTGDSGWRYRDLMHHVVDNRIGGFIWFQSNVFETAWLTQQAQRASKIPMLISADLEAGIGMRFLDTTYWPTAMAVAATGDPKFAEEQGRITAREAKVLGINHIYAPVADVNINPANPVINTRSYGEDPQTVGRFVAAFVRGVQSEGVLATAKHFPGHGDTHVDSHRSLPVLSADRSRLEQVELVPFRAAVDAGVASVMIGHLAVPALDKTPVPIRDLAESAHENPYGTSSAEITLDGTIPATLSRAIIEGLLRKDLGFRGLVVSDAFDMGGLVAHYDAGEAAIQGILAGEDQILKSPNTDAAVAAVKEAVRSGRISEARIDESVQRILDAKSKVGFSVGSMDEIFRTIDRKEHRDVANEIARRALTLLREEPGVLPLRKESRVVILSVSDFDEVANPLPDFAREAAARLTSKPPVFMLDSRSLDEDAAPVLEAARNADVVILALGIRARSGAGHMALPDIARKTIDALPPNVKMIAIAFGSPYLLQSVPNLPTYIAAYGPQPVLQVAAAAAIFGEAPITGRLPVTIPGFYPRGSGVSR